MQKLTLVVALAIAGCSTTGCHAYHTMKFAKQDKQPPSEEPHLLAQAPGGTLEILATAELAAIHKGKDMKGGVDLVSSEQGTFLHVTNWSTVEAPDLYFYLSMDSLHDLEEDNDRIEDTQRSLQLTANNLRPSNLGFAGDSLWFSVPDEFAKAKSVVIHCTAFSKLFNGGDFAVVSSGS